MVCIGILVSACEGLLGKAKTSSNGVEAHEGAKSRVGNGNSERIWYDINIYNKYKKDRDQTKKAFFPR